MSDVTIQRGAVKLTIKGASPLLVKQGSALIVGQAVTPVIQAVPRLRLVQTPAA